MTATVLDSLLLFVNNLATHQLGEVNRGLGDMLYSLGSREGRLKEDHGVVSSLRAGFPLQCI